MASARSTAATATAATITLVFSDIEGSTRLLQKLGDAYADLLERHNSILRATVAECGGREIDAAGDGFFLAFTTARDAVAAAVLVQQRLSANEWPQGVTLRVRLGLHTGEPSVGGGGYVGLDVHRAARICSAASGGQILLSASTHALVKGDLPEGVTLRDLGTHRLKDLHHAERLYQLDIAGLESVFAPVGGIAQGVRNVLQEPTQLVGRTREVAEIRQLLDRPDVRAVTLTGPGGTGKTRLALAVALAAADSFENGAWFVSLASIRESSLVGPTIARALDITERPDRTVLDCISTALASRETLLVLDNFEQVTGAAPLIADLLGACPKLEIIVTSRGALRIRSEYEYPVPPLSLPERREWTDASVLSSSPAVALFVERARAVRPDFELTNHNAPAIAEICSRLDGLPLALELAAARVRVFSADALLSRLGRGLDVLKGGARDMPERHQALRRTIAWSHDLLSSAEQKLFRRIGVFNGGFSLEAAEHVAAAAGALAMDTLDGVESLVDRGLLRRDRDVADEARFTMLETIREFALEQLTASDEESAARQAHADYFSSFAEHAGAQLAGTTMALWLDRLEADHANLRDVLTWTETTGNVETAERLAGSIWRFMIIRGHMRDGRDFMERVYHMGGDPSPTRGHLLDGYATMCHELGNFRMARRLLEESLTVWRTLEDESGIARATTGLAWVAIMAGDLETGLELSSEALNLYRTLDNEAGITLALHQIGWVYASQGRTRLAIDTTEEVLRRRVALGDRRAIAFTRTNLASSLIQAGEYERAETLLDEAFVTLTMLGDNQISAWNLLQQALLARMQGDSGRAAELMQESLVRWRETGNVYGLARALTLECSIVLDLEDFERAAGLVDQAVATWGTTESLWGELACALPAARLALHNRNAAGAARHLIPCIERVDMIGTAFEGSETLEILATVAQAENDPAAAAIFLAAERAERKRSGIPVAERRRASLAGTEQWCVDRGVDPYEPSPDDPAAQALDAARRIAAADSTETDARSD